MPPESTPVITEAQGGIIPELGVAATKPAIVPEQNPTMPHRRSSRKSSRHQVIPAIPAASMEFQTAMTARRFAPKADPPLKPSHPAQRRKVPRLTRETLRGANLNGQLAFIYQSRLLVWPEVDEFRFLSPSKHPCKRKSAYTTPYLDRSTACVK